MMKRYLILFAAFGVLFAIHQIYPPAFEVIEGLLCGFGLGAGYRILTGQLVESRDLP